MQAGDEASKQQWVAQVSIADFLQRNPEGFLVKIVFGEAIRSRIAKNDADTSAVPLHQVLLGRRIPDADSLR